jgi:hypothetical protein
MTSIDQLVGYEQVKRRNTPQRESLPDWVSEGFPFPLHPQYKVLLDAYQQAKAQHVEAVGVVQFAVQRRVENPDVQHSKESLEECRKEEERTRKALSDAERSLRDFIRHSPKERIKLIEAEIANLESDLVDAIARESEYTQRLLSDPHLARARLDRILRGHSGESVEYSPDQLAELRSLRGTVEELQGKILNFQRDIGQIQRLVLEQERKQEIQAAMDVALLKFNQVCTDFADSWAELQNVAGKHGLRFDATDLRAPLGATFQPGGNVIHIKLK